jgi:hypothetical protein
MFVISDTFDLGRIGRVRKVNWRENLVCGVAAHGTATRGYEAAASWLIEATELSGIVGDMEYAGYDHSGEKRTRPIRVSSFERLARGKLRGARASVGLLFRGEHDAIGCQRGSLLVGGGTSERPRRRRTRNGPELIAEYPYQPFDAEFCFPLNSRPRDTASELLRRSVDLMDAEYGYFFTLDDMLGPLGYASGWPAPLDWSPSATANSREVADWHDFVAEGLLWVGKWPLLRDLFEVNLISDRHTSVPIAGLGHLSDWIRAAPGRGDLEDVGRGRLLWTLTSAEIFNIRPLLNEAGLLFSCRDRVYRDLTPNFRDSWAPPT